MGMPDLRDCAQGAVHLVSRGVGDRAMIDDAFMTRADFWADPYAYLEPLRGRGRTSWNEFARAWFVTGHADVMEALKHESLGNNRLSPVFEAMEPSRRSDLGRLESTLAHTVTVLGGDAHERVRHTFEPALFPHSVEPLRERLHDVCAVLVENARVKGVIDAINDLAVIASHHAVSSALGFPAEVRARTRGIADTIRLAFDVPVGDFDGFLQAQQASLELFTILHEAVDEVSPEQLHDDLANVVKNWRANVISDVEFNATLLDLILGDHENTSNVIGNGLIHFQSHPDQWERLRDDRSLLPGAVEELLRMGPSSLWLMRIVNESCEIAGRPFDAGDSLLCVQGTANRDPEVFERAGEFDITRSPSAPHLTFSEGRHVCPGQALARVIIESVLSALLDVGDIRIIDSSIRWKRWHRWHGPASLQVRLGKPMTA